MIFSIDGLILITGVLILLGIVSSKLSARLGVPVLALFLLLGMLAGSEGIGGIEFNDYELAHSTGTVALVLILFDGGMGTSLEAVRAVWKPAVSLATVGVLITSVLTGLAAMWILEFSWLEGLLLGSIVGSTDAAAVFSVLRAGGISLPKKLVSTLELESGSNDPMAIFMTIGCIEVLMGQREFGWGLLGMFFSQMFIGTIVGVGIGLMTVRIVNSINLGAAGLYPVLVTAFCLLIFGLTAWLGGSGFLAVYLAGIVIGNSRLVFQRGILLFHDAAAWLSQIVMFVVLGLLSFPNKLLNVAPQGLLIGAVLILLARPIAVIVSLVPFRFNWRELAFISWVGLKGAVPITLATFPLLFFKAPETDTIFNITFFVVVLSALVQGWTLPTAARLLKLEQPHRPPPPLTLEISSLRHIDSDIVDYTVSDQSRAAGRTVKELALPGGVVIALISRGEEIIPPQGNTTILQGDHVILVLRPEMRPMVDRIFSMTARAKELPEQIEFPLRPSTMVRELEEVYGIELDTPGEHTLDAAIIQRVGAGQPLQDRVVRFGQIALRVRKLNAAGAIEQIGMIICVEPEEEKEHEKDKDNDNDKEKEKEKEKGSTAEVAESAEESQS